MRLINTASIQLHEFTNDENVPPYAILSHTWEDQEVTYQDMKTRGSDPSVTSMKGYDKVVQCCHQAFQKGLEWAWVDTYGSQEMTVGAFWLMSSQVLH
jgi:hypothetical protein